MSGLGQKCPHSQPHFGTGYCQVGCSSRDNSFVIGGAEEVVVGGRGHVMVVEGSHIVVL